MREPSYCDGCVYNGSLSGGSLRCCNYFLMTGKRRPCPPGEGGTVKIDRGSKQSKMVCCKYCNNCTQNRRTDGTVFMYFCSLHRIEVRPSDFCSCGERRAEDG